MALTTTLEKKQNQTLSKSIEAQTTVEAALEALSNNKLNKTGKAASSSQADKLTNTTAIGSATKPVYFTANGVPAACTYSLNKDVPSNAVFTDSHYTTKLYVTGSTGTTNAQTSNGATYLRLFDDSTNRSSINIKGTGATTVSSDSNGAITINSTDTNTAHTHKAGAGLTGSGSSGTSGEYTYKVNLVNETKSSNASSYTAGGTTKFYAVQLDKDGKLAVNVPWTDTHLNINDINYDANYAINVGSLDINNGITFNNNNGTIQQLIELISPSSDVIRRSINLVFTSVKQSGNALGKVNSLMMTANISKTSNSDSAEYLLVGYFKVTVSSNDKRIYKLYIGLSNSTNGYQCDAFKCELYGTF